ncbi:MAG TPA: AraC family transcriptional regulator [Gemmataceae bacterium]|jgi:AraC-like DNA-binding protein|nr:AraC family transcriptional regulator [Gemmataceae bacterium]
MFYRCHRPAPPLAEFIEWFWYCADVPTYDRVRILPSGTVELVVNLRDDEVLLEGPVRRRLSGAVVSGTYGGFLVVDPMQHASMIGVHFRPGGAAPFLGAAPGDLTDAHADLAGLWGRSAVELRERLCAARTPEGRFAVLERMLAARLARAPGRHRAVPAAVAALERPEARVREVAAETGLSQRRFIRVFAAEVGLTPKLYGRVRRFQRARGLVRPGSPPDWARIAAECGYFDQAHLIRDFQAFAGFSPGEFVRQLGGRVMPNHILQPS